MFRKFQGHKKSTSVQGLGNDLPKMAKFPYSGIIKGKACTQLEAQSLVVFHHIKDSESMG
jgi:hypothetical protein